MNIISNFQGKCQKLRYDSGFNFTERESEAIVMAVEDLRYKEISVEMDVTESAVRQFFKNSREKTCCATNIAMIFILAKYLQ